MAYVKAPRQDESLQPSRKYRKTSVDRAKSGGDGRRESKRHKQGFTGLVKYFGF